jgi:hypothetical protein
MRSQREFFEEFKALHEAPGAFVVGNAWDGGSAVLAKAAGFKALATSSAAIAFTLGRLDGTRAVTREEHMKNGELIIKLTDLPLQGDTEDGFGPAPEDAALTVDASIAAGFAGLSIEDTTANRNKPIHDFEDAVVRVKKAAERAKGKILLTARTDNFIHLRSRSRGSSRSSPASVLQLGVTRRLPLWRLDRAANNWKVGFGIRHVVYKVRDECLNAHENNVDDICIAVTCVSNGHKVLIAD